jgi:hypothetical protein
MISVENPLFEFTNEIVVYGKDKVWILMYATQELSALLIQSQTLHHTLKSMFNFIWDVEWKLKKRTSKVAKK